VAPEEALEVGRYDLLPPRIETAEYAAIHRRTPRGIYKRVRRGIGPMPVAKNGGRFLFDRDEVLVAAGFAPVAEAQ